MDARTIKLSGLSYELGAREGRFDDLPETAAILERYNMSGPPDVWGFGAYRKTELGYFEIVTRVGREVLASTGRDPAEIDALYLCSATFPFDFETMNLAIARLLSHLGLTRAVPVVISGAGCAASLQGIVTGAREIRSGDLDTILMLTTDIVAEGGVRFYQYATISDGASGLVISGDGRGELEVVGSCLATRPSLMLKDDQYVAGQKEMYLAASERVFAGTGLGPADVRAVLASNLHLPIQRVFANAGGYASSRVFSDNVMRIGHCYGSDPFINFVDRAAAHRPMPDDLFMLQSSAMGHVGNVLVRVA